MKKVKIYTWSDKRPDFIEKQLDTIKAFVKDADWEFIVFNNTPIIAPLRRKAIKAECKRLGLKCLDVRFRSFISGSAQICAWGIRWAFQRFFRWDKNSIHVIFDSDMFFVNDFNFNEYLGENAIAAIHQQRDHVEYLWNGFVIFDSEKLPDHNHFDYDCGEVEGVRTDVGGYLYYWMKRNSDVKIKWVKHTGFVNKLSDRINILPESVREKYQDDFCLQFIEGAVLHYRAGSNWDKKPPEFVKAKSEYLEEILQLVMSGKTKFPPVDDNYYEKE